MERKQSAQPPQSQSVQQEQSRPAAAYAPVAPQTSSHNLANTSRSSTAANLAAQQPQLRQVQALQPQQTQPQLGQRKQSFREPTPAWIRDRVAALRETAKNERRRSEQRAAQYQLAKYMIEETEILSNFEHEQLKSEAYSILAKLSKSGFAEAQYYLGKAYAEDRNQDPPNLSFSAFPDSAAFPLFTKAARQSHPAAAYALASCYECGLGCKIDLRSAAQYYKQAASAGNEHAMFRVGTAYLNGEAGFPENAKEGLKWLKRCTSTPSTIRPQALLQLSLLVERGVPQADLPPNPSHALSYLMEAADARFPPAQTRLARAYEVGRMGLPVNMRRAVRLYQAAARGGDPSASLAQSSSSASVTVLPQDEAQAVYWARQAASKGHPGAEYAMGYFCENGIGSVRDLGKAMAWYRQAAEHGSRLAKRRLEAG
ncbi:hypothetical protein DFJ73DRAFT_624662 [Zopfochytrium polystomum]|nr:hypothetical protein DFJ73DRAFT_624662 [Zopfochytrium polystomum]